MTKDFPIHFKNSPEQIAPHQHKKAYFKKLSERTERFVDSVSKLSNENDVPIKFTIQFQITDEQPYNNKE